MKPFEVSFKIGRERIYGHVVAFIPVGLNGQPGIVAIVVTEGGEVQPMDLDQLSATKPIKP